MTDVIQPKVDLRVFMARQNTGFLTDAAWPDPSTISKPVNYIVRRDGVWELRKSRAGVFVIQREKFTSPLPGFPEEGNVEFGISNFGKIPINLFREILAFFKSICDESKDEAYVQTFWDPAEKRYFNHVPPQRVSGASVNFERDIGLEARCYLVLETHSHNTMGAFFSGTDNADEKSDRFFAVIGKLNNPTPEMLFSFVCGGKRVIISRHDIFEEEPEAQFPGDWKSRITKYPTAPIRSFSSDESFSMEDERSSMTSRSRNPTQLDIETEIEMAITNAHRKLAAVSADATFFQNSISDSDNDSKLQDLVRSTTARITNGGIEMTRVQKQRMFDKLVDAMTIDDVIDLVGSLLEAGYEESILSVLPEASDENISDSVHADPFLNE